MADEGLTVARLGPGDGEPFAQMNALFAAVFDDAESYASLPPGDAYRDSLLADDKIVLLLAVIDGAPVGALGAYELRKFEQERSEFYLYDLAVDAHARRRGVATALVERLRDIARAAGGWMIFVQSDTMPEDEPALAFYRSIASSEEHPVHFDIEP